MPRYGQTERIVILLPQVSFLIPERVKGSERTIELDIIYREGRGAPAGIQAPSPCVEIVEAPMREAFHIGQLVRITRPVSGCADHRTYCIVCLVSTSDGYAFYRVKNTVGIERLVRADEIEPAALTAVP